MEQKKTGKKKEQLKLFRKMKYSDLFKVVQDLELKKMKLENKLRMGLMNRQAQTKEVVGSMVQIKRSIARGKMCLLEKTRERV